MTISWWRFSAYLGFFVEQNIYFGWNAFPQSDTELLADGFTLLLLSLCFVSKGGAK